MFSGSVRQIAANSGSRRRVQILTVLAAGLVLGMGATNTLAAWTDTETASGSFTASVFSTVSKDTTESNFSSHDTAPATLSFAATGMSPGALYAAGLDVRTTAASTIGGTASLVSSAVSGDSLITDQLEYRSTVTTNATSCSAAAYPATFTAASAIPSGVQGALNANAGNVVRFCFQVRLKATAPNNIQGKQGAINWSFTSTSSS